MTWRKKVRTVQGGRPIPMWRCYRAVLAEVIREYPPPRSEKLEARFTERQSKRQAVYIEGLHASHEDAHGRIWLRLSCMLPAMGSYEPVKEYLRPPAGYFYASQTWLDMERLRVRSGHVYPVTNGRVYGDAKFYRIPTGEWYIRKLGSFQEVRM